MTRASGGMRTLSPIRLRANICEVDLMILEYLLGGIVTAGLLVYLTYVLLRPERF